MANTTSQLLTPIVLAVLGATVVQGLTSFTLTQLLSKSAQRMIADLRRQVQAHIGRLSVSFYDANKTGVLVSRIMSDVEGVRNLIGTGLVEFAGGVMTGGARAGDSAAHQRDHDGDCVQRAAGFWAGAEQGVCDDPADFSRAAEDQRGSYRDG